MLSGQESRALMRGEPEESNVDPVGGLRTDLRGAVADGQVDALTEFASRIRESLEERLEQLEHRLLEAKPTMRPMLTERDLAKLLRCDVRTVRRLERSGDLPGAVRFGGSKRWLPRAIEAWLEDLSGGAHE